MADAFEDRLADLGGMHLANWALLNALVIGLKRKGILTNHEVREVYEGALLGLEEKQGAEPMLAHQIAIARLILEGAVRGEPPWQSGGKAQ